jgi:hypothetical protein
MVPERRNSASAPRSRPPPDYESGVRSSNLFGRASVFNLLSDKCSRVASQKMRLGSVWEAIGLAPARLGRAGAPGPRWPDDAGNSARKSRLPIRLPTVRSSMPCWEFTNARHGRCTGGGRSLSGGQLRRECGMQSSPRSTGPVSADERCAARECLSSKMFILSIFPIPHPQRPRNSRSRASGGTGPTCRRFVDTPAQRGGPSI